MRKIIAHNRSLEIFYSVGENLYVESRYEGEHHSVNRADARRYVKEIDSTYEICAYVGPVFFRDGDGYPVRNNRYSVVKIG